MKWKVLESEYLFDKKPWLTIRKDVCELPGGKIMPAYYVCEYPTWSTVFAVTKDREVVMVKQYRHGLDLISIETPGGVVDEGEEPQVAIKRELKEETGYVAGKVEFLGKISANPATTNNYMYMFLATDCEKQHEQSLDETEDVEVVVYSLAEIKQLIREHKIVQSLHLSCMLYALERMGELHF